MSLSVAVRRANEEGLRNRQGKEFRYQHLRAVLRNPVLFGGVPEVDYDAATGHAIERSIRPALDQHGNPHLINEPLMTYEEWQHLQVLVGQKLTWVKNRSGEAPLLAGLIICGGGPLGSDGIKVAGACGQRMSGSGTPHEKSTYTCRVSMQNRMRCAGNSVIQVAVENWVTAVFLQLLSQPDFAQRHAELVAKALDKGEERAAECLAELRELQTELQDLEERARTKTGRGRLAAIDGIEETQARIAEVQESLTESWIAPERLQPFVNRDPNKIWATATQGQRAAWLTTVFSRVEILPAFSGNSAEKGGFGSRGLAPRRVRIYTHHDPANPIVAPDDYQRPAPDLGGPVECPNCGEEQKTGRGSQRTAAWPTGSCRRRRRLAVRPPPSTGATRRAATRSSTSRCPCVITSGTSMASRRTTRAPKPDGSPRPVERAASELDKHYGQGVM
jgi:hypothetical protein